MAMVIPPQVNRNAVGWLSIPWVRFMPKIPASRKNKNILVPQGAGLEPWNQGFGAVLFWGGSGTGYLFTGAGFGSIVLFIYWNCWRNVWNIFQVSIHVYIVNILFLFFTQLSIYKYIYFFLTVLAFKFLNYIKLKFMLEVAAVPMWRLQPNTPALGGSETLMLTRMYKNL